MKILTSVMAAVAVAGATPAAANLLVNGNFEASTSQTATPPGWTNIGHADGVISYASFGTPAYDGDYYYDIGGYGGAQPALGDGITQTVTTTANSLYTLTFGYSGENTVGVTTVLDVLIGSMLTQFTIVGDGSGVFLKPFTTTSINYLATGASTAISFTISSSTNIGNNDPLLDGIVFDLARDGSVPEPATWALMIGGFGLVGVAARRRRTAVTAWR